MNYRLEEIDLHNSSQEKVQDLVTIIKRIQSQIFPEDPVEPDETIKTQLLVQLDPKEFVIHTFIIHEKDNNNMIGFCFYGWFAEGSERGKGNETLAIIEIQIDPKHRRKGIGESIYNTVLSKVKDAGKKILMVNSVEEDGKSFLKNRGFQIALNQPLHRVKFADINWKIMDEWIKEGETINPSTEIRIYENFPEDIIDEYAKTFTKTHEQIPRGELQIQDMKYTPEYLRKSYEKSVKMGITQLTAVALEHNGEVSGFTFFNYSPTRVPIIDQGITAVLEEHRGRKLGKWLKAVMLREVKSRYPNINQAQSSIATTNAPMNSINERIGFKVYKEQIMAQKMLE